MGSKLRIAAITVALAGLVVPAARAAAPASPATAATSTSDLQVQSTARKPLSIAFEEIEADKILGYWPDPEAEADDAEDAEPAE